MEERTGGNRALRKATVEMILILLVGQWEEK